MIRYYITDRQALGGTQALLRNVERLADGIDYVQVRERDLSTRDLEELVRQIVRSAHAGVRVLVNDRADVAIAAGAHGVHLRGNAIAPSVLRRAVPASFQISVACHSIGDVLRAGGDGANLALLAPIFETPGKGPALGLEVLRQASRAAIPVIALGGVTAELTTAAVTAGAAGIAGIRLFQTRYDGWSPDV